jgi:hypothetical protein
LSCTVNIIIFNTTIMMMDSIAVSANYITSRSSGKSSKSSESKKSGRALADITNKLSSLPIDGNNTVKAAKKSAARRGHIESNNSSTKSDSRTNKSKINIPVLIPRLKSKSTLAPEELTEATNVVATGLSPVTAATDVKSPRPTRHVHIFEDDYDSIMNSCLMEGGATLSVELPMTPSIPSTDKETSMQLEKSVEALSSLDSKQVIKRSKRRSSVGSRRSKPRISASLSPTSPGFEWQQEPAAFQEKMPQLTGESICMSASVELHSEPAGTMTIPAPSGAMSLNDSMSTLEGCLLTFDNDSDRLTMGAVQQPRSSFASFEETSDPSISSTHNFISSLFTFAPHEPKQTSFRCAVVSCVDGANSIAVASSVDESDCSAFPEITATEAAVEPTASIDAELAIDSVTEPQAEQLEMVYTEIRSNVVCDPVACLPPADTTEGYQCKESEIMLDEAGVEAVPNVTATNEALFEFDDDLPAARPTRRASMSCKERITKLATPSRRKKSTKETKDDVVAKPAPNSECIVELRQVQGVLSTEVEQNLADFDFDSLDVDIPRKSQRRASVSCKEKMQAVTRPKAQVLRRRQSKAGESLVDIEDDTFGLPRVSDTVGQSGQATVEASEVVPELTLARGSCSELNEICTNWSQSVDSVENMGCGDNMDIVSSFVKRELPRRRASIGPKETARTKDTPRKGPATPKSVRKTNKGLESEPVQEKQISPHRTLLFDDDNWLNCTLSGGYDDFCTAGGPVIVERIDSADTTKTAAVSESASCVKLTTASEKLCPANKAVIASKAKTTAKTPKQDGKRGSKRVGNNIAAVPAALPQTFVDIDPAQFIQIYCRNSIITDALSALGQYDSSSQDHTGIIVLAVLLSAVTYSKLYSASSLATLASLFRHISTVLTDTSLSHKVAATTTKRAHSTKRKNVAFRALSPAKDMVPSSWLGLRNECNGLDKLDDYLRQLQCELLDVPTNQQVGSLLLSSLQRLLECMSTTNGAQAAINLLVGIPESFLEAGKVTIKMTAQLVLSGLGNCERGSDLQCSISQYRDSTIRACLRWLFDEPIITHSKSPAAVHLMQLNSSLSNVHSQLTLAHLDEKTETITLSSLIIQVFTAAFANRS